MCSLTNVFSNTFSYGCVLLLTIYGTGLAIFKALFVMIFTAHLMACFFYMMMDKQACVAINTP
jgi:hypothetical protein